MSKPTPGPWFNDGGIIYPENGDPEGIDWIADCRSRNPADARLIAATPDLLEALCKYVALDELRGNTGTNLFRDARAVIAKSTGSEA